MLDGLAELNEIQYKEFSNPEIVARISQYEMIYRMHVHDLNATIMHQMGVNHEKLTYRFQGRDFRLTDIHGKVIHDILA